MQESPEYLKVDFVKEREEAYKCIFKRSPIVSSHSVGWNDLIIAYDQYPPGEILKNYGNLQ